MPGPDERAVAIPLSADGAALEGLYRAGPAPDSGGAVVAPPHPLYGGSMDSPVVNEVAHACWKAGLASLRFNWRGVGASAGQPSGEAADADADYGAALSQLAETVDGPLLAAGYSFGALAALRASGHPRVRRLLLVSPPAEALDREILAAFRGGLLLVTGERDVIAPAGALEQLTAELPAVLLHVVPDADHFFGVGLAELARVASAWL